MLMIVLLNDAWTCATASRICRFDFFRTFAPAAAPAAAPLGAAARAGVRTRALAPQRQAAAVTDAAVATEVHQPFDVHRGLAAQVALDRESRDHVADTCD